MSDDRIARCVYYGLKDKPGYGSCSTARATREEKKAPWGIPFPCKCEQPSREGLAFFQERTDRDYDEFYCGCKGWD